MQWSVCARTTQTQNAFWRYVDFFLIVAGLELAEAKAALAEEAEQTRGLRLASNTQADAVAEAVPVPVQVDAFLQTTGVDVSDVTAVVQP